MLDQPVDRLETRGRRRRLPKAGDAEEGGLFTYQPSTIRAYKRALGKDNGHYASNLLPLRQSPASVSVAHSSRSRSQGFNADADG